ncbi:MAG: ABC transporter permease [Thermodesulfobacteriota bacterium]|nr:ABC transporter permease [Thermodesulfobacteriota bacterium]
MTQIKKMTVFWTYRSLLFALVRRQLSLRYAGTALGLLWSVLTPLLMLSIYSYVFSFVFKARWQGMDGSIGFALMVFCGLIPFYAIVDILAYSPTLFRTQSNLIKKMIFPMEILPAVSVMMAFFHMSISLILLLVFFLGAGISPGMNIFLLPLILAPILFWGMGLSILFSLIGVLIRDIVHLVQFITGLFLFLSPIFYSIDRIPQGLQWILKINPLTYIIEWIRASLIPDSYLPVRGFVFVTIAGGIVFIISFKMLLKYKSEVVDGI